jgi:hypothetical protein
MLQGLLCCPREVPPPIASAPWCHIGFFHFHFESAQTHYVLLFLYCFYYIYTMNNDATGTPLFVNYLQQRQQQQSRN